MLDFHQKRKMKSFMYNKVTIIVLFLLCLVLIHSTWSVYKKKRESEELKNLSEKQVTSLKERNADLEWKLKKLETTPGLEEEIRSKFNVAKENESMVIVVEKSLVTNATTSQNGGFWHKFLNFFKN